jgi:hypothetical protein
MNANFRFRLLFVFLTIIVYSHIVSALYILMREGEKKCFISEVPKDTLISGKFKCEPERGPTAVLPLVQQPNEFEQRGMGIIVEVRDPLDREVMNKVFDRESKFALASQIGGEHKICFQTNTSSWFNPLTFRFYLDLGMGYTSGDYEEIAKKEHLSALELKIRKLYDTTQSIAAEQRYQKAREARFRDTSESTNARVVWWSIFQIAIVVLSAIWQIRHLKSFFKKNKLI